MSILEKCEKIGVELRRTKEGKDVLACLTEINKNPQELTVELFKLINKHYIQIHFYSIQNAIDIFEENIDNLNIGILVSRILAIDGLKEFGAVNIPIANFIEELSIMLLNNTVKYQLPKNIAVTPELVRLSNSLTVECLRINLLQQIMNESKINPRFLEIMKRFDDLRGTHPILPYSKQDRENLKVLKREYTNTYFVELVYSLTCMLTFIKSMIFDSFFDNIFDVFEGEDIISRKQKSLYRCSIVKLVLNPNIKFLRPNTGWILKLHNKDKSISYGQIFSKTINFNKGECTVKVKALIHDYL